MSARVSEEALRKVELFRDFNGHNLALILKHVKRESYAKYDLILGPENQRDGIFGVVEGRVRLFRLSVEGEEVTLDTLHAGEVFGLLFIAPDLRSNTGLQAMTDGTVVYRIDPGWLRRFMQSHPEVALKGLELTGRLIETISERAEEFALHDVKTRLAHQLARLAGQSPQHIVWETHAELAALVGTTQQEVTRALRYFRNEGWIASRPRRRGILVLDLQRLASHGREYR